MRFHKALCNLILNASYLGNLFQCLISLVVKKCLLISNLNLASFNLEPLPLVLSLQNVAKSLSLSNLPDLLGDIGWDRSLCYPVCLPACLSSLIHSFHSSEKEIDKIWAVLLWFLLEIPVMFISQLGCLIWKRTRPLSCKWRPRTGWKIPRKVTTTGC